MVFEWLMRKIDTENGVSNFSSGGRVGVVVVVMVEVEGNERGTRCIVHPFGWGILFTH